MQSVFIIILQLLMLCSTEWTTKDVKNSYDSENSESSNSLKLCPTPSRVNFTLIQKSTLPGALMVTFKSPQKECTYGKIGLFVDWKILNEEDCRNHRFSGLENEEYMYTLLQNISASQEVVTLSYKYVFTGCYALSFEDGNPREIQSNTFLRTDYSLPDKRFPIFGGRCAYIGSDIDSGSQVAIFTVTFTLPRDSVHLTVRPISADAVNKSITDINWSSDGYLSDTEFKFDLKMISNGSDMETECRFDYLVESNSFYSLLTTVKEKRCSREVWKSVFTCTAYIPCSGPDQAENSNENSTSSGQNSNSMYADNTTPFFSILAVATVAAVIGGVLFVHYKKQFKSTNLSSSLYKGTDDSGRPLNNSNNDIVLLYVKDTSEFMTSMAQFREIIKEHCKCNVHDWHAKNELNKIAQMGGSNWVGEMLRSRCRVIWVDTSKARNFAHFRSNNTGEFFETDFPVALEMAKRDVETMSTQYSSHFVIRVEGFEPNEEEYDPFGNLSPRTRYTIPLHLAELCEALSRWYGDTTELQRINDEKTESREEFQTLIELNSNCQMENST